MVDVANKPSLWNSVMVGLTARCAKHAEGADEWDALICGDCQTVRIARTVEDYSWELTKADCTAEGK